MDKNPVVKNLCLEIIGALLEAQLFLPMLLVHRKTLGKGKGQPVMILPGFMGGDGSVKVLSFALRAFGFSAYTWGQGRNHGHYASLERALEQRFIGLYRKHKTPIALVGWSLGGRFALRLADQYPELVSKVITIGSPLGRLDVLHIDEARNAIPKRYHNSLEHVLVEVMHAIKEPPAHIPVTSIIGMSDKFVPVHMAEIPKKYLTKGAYRENIHIRWSVHLSMGWSARIAALIIDRLLQDHPWQPFQFERSRFGRLPLFFEQKLAHVHA